MKVFSLSLFIKQAHEAGWLAHTYKSQSEGGRAGDLGVFQASQESDPFRKSVVHLTKHPKGRDEKRLRKLFHLPPGVWGGKLSASIALLVVEQCVCLCLCVKSHETTY